MKYLASLPIILANPFDKEWHEWKIKYNQNFPTAAIENSRYKIFTESRQFVQLHNERFHNEAETYEVELNKFAAMTTEEVAAGFKTRLRNLENEVDFDSQNLKSDPSVGRGSYEWDCPETFKSNGSPLPTLISYAAGKNCTSNDESTCSDIQILSTNVKDQGYCGSCWTFGTNVAIEGYLCKSGRFDCTAWTGLSEQQLVDCASRTNRNSEINLTPFDNFACQGGFQQNAIRYIMKNNYQMNSYDDYPYISGDTRRMNSECQFNDATAVQNVLNTCGTFRQGDENAMAQVVNEIGPLTIGVDSSGRGFDLYKSGIYSNKNCGKFNKDLDHAVAVTGYGVYPFGDPKKGTNYWEVKNSWGPDWGMDGYILFEKDNNNACGVATDTAYVV